jgi:hypothetical protein
MKGTGYVFKFDTSGFDKLQRKLKQVEGENSIPLTELFHVGFMNKYTQFNSIEDMFNQSPFKIESEKDFALIDDFEWDKCNVPLCQDTKIKFLR